MPFIRSISTDETEYIDKKMRSGKGSDMYVIEEHGSHDSFLAKLYCHHDHTNVTTDELNSYFNCDSDDDSTEQCIENDSHCFGGIRVSNTKSKWDLNDVEYNTVSKQCHSNKCG